ncbi:alkene reductase [Lentilactobacillus diolivorans]|uniref:NADH:flavin oxidoreductase/NADH oxidase N-terminal domain-containing protein n=2 Tax=Lentilactobacillus diolivorans TaxID=179838 RepID=A0A0R1S9B1_9LACO|nr:alkene reductase [Lentilactobacillus diolivorans]KRL65521.1 hypothetical protein FC85_GL000070 [Lentilactobacillus diolivorans DSM 14421]GEP24179.1 alkene reductase [Lentilactobacillus diolivorans]
MKKLWDQPKLGNIELSNRLVMAPMTRSRAELNGVPGSLAAKYYSQRASMGLIITEGAQPSAAGQGYLKTPGIYTNDHISGWRRVTDAVHEKGGKIFIQLMHVGRMAHPDNTPAHHQPVAPSAIAPNEKIFTATGMQSIPTPHALSEQEIQQTIADYRHGAAAVIEAGADGVEIHGANGYLIHQFLGQSSNVRQDNYGGSIQNRARLALEIARAVTDEIGPERVGFRVSPLNLLGGVNEGPEAKDLYHYLVTELNQLNLAYLHVMHVGHEDILADIRHAWQHSLIVNRAGRPIEELSDDLNNNLADLVSVGNFSLANPDLVTRLKKKVALNEPNPKTFYVDDGPLGYTDYPEWSKI